MNKLILISCLSGVELHLLLVGLTKLCLYKQKNLYLNIIQIQNISIFFQTHGLFSVNIMSRFYGFNILLSNVSDSTSRSQ